MGTGKLVTDNDRINDKDYVKTKHFNECYRNMVKIRRGHFKITLIAILSISSLPLDPLLHKILSTLH